MFINLQGHAWNTAGLAKSLINEFMQIYSPHKERVTLHLVTGISDFQRPSLSHSYFISAGF